VSTAVAWSVDSRLDRAPVARPPTSWPALGRSRCRARRPASARSSRTFRRSLRLSAAVWVSPLALIPARYGPMESLDFNDDAVKPGEGQVHAGALLPRVETRRTTVTAAPGRRRPCPCASRPVAGGQAARLSDGDDGRARRRRRTAVIVLGCHRSLVRPLWRGSALVRLSRRRGSLRDGVLHFFRARERV
jgi:hypothetical protein